jgi:hypothetical protein
MKKIVQACFLFITIYCKAQLNFTTAQDYPSFASHAINCADYNLDGHADIVSLNLSPVWNITDGMLVFNGDGMGTVGAGSSLTNGWYPIDLVSADFNNDGRIDVLTCNYNGCNISLFLTNSNGSFDPPIVTSFPCNVMAIKSVDINHDGNLDLICCSQYNTVYVYLGSGTGTFVLYSNFQVGSGPRSLVCGDFNADGEIDIATANINSNDISVALGNGTNVFNNIMNYPAGAQPWSIISFDVNNDGINELLTANENSNNISVLVGNGNGTFASQVNYLVGSSPKSLVNADFDGDGIQDLACANSVSGNISVLLGTLNGTFNVPVNFAVNGGPIDLAVSDFDEDGKTDLAISNNTSIVSILLNACPQVSAYVSSKTNASCFGASDGAITVNATGGSGFTYVWSPMGGPSNVATGLPAGLYECRVTNSCGEYTILKKIEISQPQSASIISGPGGVGDNMDTEMWFDASKLTLANNTAVTTLTDRSGNARNATQATANRKPLFLTNQLNGLPVINFDGANDFLATGSVPDLDTDKQTWFVVTKANNGTHTGQIIGSGYTAGSSVGADHFWKTTISSTGQYGSFIRNSAGTASQIISSYDTQYHIISNVWDGNTDIHTMFTDGTLNGTVTGRNASPTGHLRVRLGTNSGTTLTYWYNGRIAEAFVYSKTLNDAERIIVENYLSTKYNIPLTGLDIFAYQNTHSFDAAGIGMTNNKTKTSARGSIVEMSQASSLANGDFLMWAHNNATTISSTADVPTAYSATSGKRMQRTWRAGKTNDVGTTTVTFYLSGIAAGSLSNLELLVDNDGIFTNATRITSGFTYDDGCKVATWTGVNLTDGQYFTIGSPNGTALLRAAAITETETELEVANNITLFPNPNNGEFSLLVNELNSNMVVEVYNSVGQIVLRESVTQDKTSLNIAKEANGIYFLKVIDGNKTVTFKKIIKQ